MRAAENREGWKKCLTKSTAPLRIQMLWYR